MLIPLYVSSVAGRLVPRFGAGGSYLGAERDPKNASAIKWYPERVLPITAPEFQRFRREYDQAIEDGDLSLRSEDDFNAQRESDERGNE
jgi:hypothetical protein